MCAAANDEVVSIFTANGILAGEGTITDGVAVIATSIGKGEIAIISIADKSVKVVAQ